MPFTTWADLAAKMRDDLASGNWRTESYEFDGMKKKYRTADDFWRDYDEVERRAVLEENGGPCLRTVARAGDR